MNRTQEAQVALTAVLLASGPVRVTADDAVRAYGATLVMEHDPATDSWLLQAVPADLHAPAAAHDSVRLPAG